MRTRLDREFEEFVRARSATLLRLAALLSGDADHAQDLVQQALWRTHRHWGQALHNPDAYVRRVLINLTHDRRRHARRRVVETVTDEPTQTTTADATAMVVERVALIGALRLVPARQRAALVLRFWEDLSVDEAAAALGCSPGTVKSNTSRGLVSLREILDSQANSDVETGKRP
ncbi:MAG: SigE family RNA polymerase sigma factor [Acidothermaceae bacterium]